MTGRFHTEGFARDTIPNIEDAAAVRWWYVHVSDDGYVFSRGGRVRTARRARTEIHHARNQHRNDEYLTHERRRLTHTLGPDGELVPLRDPEWSVEARGHRN